MVEYLSRTIRGFLRLRKLCWISTCMAIMIILCIAWVVFYSSDSFGFYVEKSPYHYSWPVLLIILIILLNVVYLNKRRESIQTLLHETKQMYNKDLDFLYEAIKGYSDIRNNIIACENKENLGEKEINLIQSAKDGKNWLSGKIEFLKIKCEVVERNIRRLDGLSDLL